MAQRANGRGPGAEAAASWGEQGGCQQGASIAASSPAHGGCNTKKNALGRVALPPDRRGAWRCACPDRHAELTERPRAVPGAPAPAPHQATGEIHHRAKAVAPISPVRVNSVSPAARSAQWPLATALRLPGQTIYSETQETPRWAILAPTSSHAWRHSARSGANTGRMRTSTPGGF